MQRGPKDKSLSPTYYILRSNSELTAAIRVTGGYIQAPHETACQYLLSRLAFGLCVAHAQNGAPYFTR